MTDHRPSLENRLSSRLSRATDPSARVLDRVARHAGSGSTISRLAERHFGALSRRAALGGSLLDSILTRLAARGGFRATQSGFGPSGLGEVVSQIPPWLARQEAAEEIVPQVARRGWMQSTPALQNEAIVGVPSSAGIARSASRPPGFAGGARRSALASPDLVTALAPTLGRRADQGGDNRIGASDSVTVVDGFAPSRAAALTAPRSASRPVGALGRSAWTGAPAARTALPSGVARAAGPSSAPLAASRRAVARAVGHTEGAAQSALARSAATDLPLSSAGVALARASDSRPSGRGFALAQRSAAFASAPALDVARAPDSLTRRVAAQSAGPLPSGSALTASPAAPLTGSAALTRSFTRAAPPQSTALTATAGAALPAGSGAVARSLARAAAVQSAQSRPLARAAAASDRSTTVESRAFAPLTAPARRSVTTDGTYIGAPRASSVERDWTGAPASGPWTAPPAGSALRAATISPVERAFRRTLGGETAPERAAGGALPRMATALSAGAMPVPEAPVGFLARRAAAEASRPLTGLARDLQSPAAPNSWTPPASVGSRPLTRSFASTLPGGSALLARSSQRPYVGAPLARATESQWVGAPLARSGAGAVESSAIMAGPGSAAARGSARLARADYGDYVPAPVAGAMVPAAPGSAHLARSSSRPLTGARLARASYGAYVGAATALPSAPLGAPSAALSRQASSVPAGSALIAGAYERSEAGTALRAGTASRSARVPTAVARAHYAEFVGAPGASLSRSERAERFETPTGTVARSLARAGQASTAALLSRRSVGPDLALPTLPEFGRTVEPTIESPAAPQTGWSQALNRSAAPVSAPTRPSAGSVPLARATASSALRAATLDRVPYVGAPTASALRSASIPPSARALARYAAGSTEAVTVPGPTATALPAASAPEARAARTRRDTATPSLGLSRQIAREENARVGGATSSLARSLTAAAALGVPARRSALPLIAGVLPVAPRALDRSADSVGVDTTTPFGPGPSAQARASGVPATGTATIARSVASPYNGALTAVSGAALARSTAPTARALARTGDRSLLPGGIARHDDPSSVVRRAAARSNAPEARAEGQARPMTAARTFDGTLPTLPRFFAPREPAAEVTTPAGAPLPRSSALTVGSSAPLPRSSAGLARAESGRRATSSVARAVQRATAEATESAGYGFQSPISAARRAAVARSSGTAYAALSSLNAPTRRAAAGSHEPAVTASSPDPMRRDATLPSARALRASSGSTALRAAAGLALPVASALMAGSSAVQRAVDAAEAPTALAGRTQTGAPLARAVARSADGFEAPTNTGSESVQRSTDLPAARIVRQRRSDPGQSAVQRRSVRRLSDSERPDRTMGAGGFSGEILTRLAKLQSSGPGSAVFASSALDPALPNAGGLVSRAAQKLVARQEAKARRRASFALPAPSALVARAGEIPTAELSRLVKRHVAEMTHVTGAAPTMSRSAASTVKRSSSTQEAQGRGADRDVGKKPDLDDFLRRAVRRIIVEETVVQERELSLWD